MMDWGIQLDEKGCKGVFMSFSSFRFGTVGSPKSTPKKPGGSVGAVLRIAELDLSA